MNPDPEILIDPQQAEAARKVELETGYPMLVTEHFARCAREARDDSLARQVVPAEGELVESLYFTTNPLKEQAPAAKNFSPVFLLQKYQSRALLLTASECFANCRFCFRRHLRERFPSENLKPEHYAEALFQLANDASLTEIILSGGEPLTLSDALFFWLLGEFQKIGHLTKIRVHTRAPIFEPGRISEKFSKKLRNFAKKSGKPIYFVLHVNHPDELSAEALAAIHRLHRAGVTLLQQGVLLRGVNDSADILAELYEKLTANHVIPYYLHQLDRVKGASHFEVSEEKGREIIQTLRARLSGFAVPRYVREIPGEPGKTPLD